MKSYDPYDIWSLPLFGRVKNSWSAGDRKVLPVLILIGIFETFFPILTRKICRAPRNEFAHVIAMHYFIGTVSGTHAVKKFKELRVRSSGWGLPFNWYSKNGVYGANTPYITNTPYVMEALVELGAAGCQSELASEMFNSTWSFLESLRIHHSDENFLALSYAPVNEPRTVVNANSYAAFAYSLHALHGVNSDVRAVAGDKSKRITAWLIKQQKPDGRWLYYADDLEGNFVDCFHSCFIVKNLIKIMKNDPSLERDIRPVIEKAFTYIRENLFDDYVGLCKRFSEGGSKDPFRWDLYDQAEYLGLLIDFGLLDEASNFCSKVRNRFFRKGRWYCRIDVFGRLWGKEFLRWGIVPFQYHCRRLENRLQSSCK